LPADCDFPIAACGQPLRIGYAQARPRGDDLEEEERADIRRLRERYRDDAG
jgi:hypothetical protein